MNWTLDIAILLILGLTVFFSVRSGFVKTAMATLSFALAVVITICLLSPVRSALLNTGLADSVTETTETAIKNYITDNKLAGTDDLIAGKSEAFDSLIAVAGIDKDELSQWYSENVKGNADERAQTLASHIAEPAVYALATLISVLLLFFVSRLLLFIVSKILEGVARLPVLKTANKLLGLLLGLVLALVRICLFCVIVNVLIDNAGFLGSDFLLNLDPDKTLLFKLFAGINIFGFFF